MAQRTPILYSYFLSSCSWRVRIALAYKEIQYEYRAVDLGKSEHFTENFMKLNPSAEVPALLIDGKVLTQSIAILEYLEETVPSPALLPKDPVSRAKVRHIVDSISSGIQPLQDDRILKRVGDHSNKWASHWIETGFQSLERILVDTHGTYCCGDEVTLADVCLVPQVFRAKQFNVNMAKFRLIREISSRLCNLNAFKDSHPFMQPDCPDGEAV